MNPGIGHQVGLELCQINVQSTVKSEGSSDRGDDLSHQSVQVGVARSLDVQVSSADIVNRLVVNHESTIRVLQSGMGCKDGVIGLYHCG